MFCVGRTKLSPLAEEFKVSGSTGNIYTVKIATLPTCSCPDHGKGNICKHLLFVFLKVLGAARAKLYHVQKALLDTELADLFASARADPSANASASLVDAYRRATGQAPLSAAEKSAAAAASRAPVTRRLPEAGDSCPICYEDLKPKQEKGLLFCEHSCGNACHEICFKQWAASSGSAGKVTCIFCRAPFPPKNSGGGASSSSAAAAAVGAGPSTSSPEGYLNLAAAAGVSGYRNDPTYYTGPRRRVTGSFGGGRRRRYDCDSRYEYDDYDSDEDLFGY